MTQNWLIYGTGKTGTMIADEALRRGHTPLLVGRSAERVRPIAEKLGLAWDVADLSDTAGLSHLLEKAEVVVHTAGPFLSTSLPMVWVCLAQKKHYLDISNEIPVFQALRALDGEARSAGVALIPAVGFGVAATDGLASYVASQIGNPTELEIATYIYSRDSSAGAAVTRLEVITRGGWLRRNGSLIRVPFGSGGKRLAFPFSECTILPIPSDDLESAFQSTGVPNITAYGAFTLSPMTARLVFPVVQKLVANAGIRKMLEGRISARADTAKKIEVPSDAHSYAWARARNERGDSFEMWQEMGEGYDFTAEAAVRAVEEVFEKQPAGMLTPTQAFGTDFALKMRGVRRFDAKEG